MKLENIKFKAKRLDNNTWVEGYFCVECGNTYIIEDRQSESMLNRNEAHQVDPSTVCQFTGEKDMNGDNIYVGDIISNLETKSVIEVVWNDKMKMLDCKFLNGVKCCFDIPFGTFVARYHRIVILRSKFDKEK
jgi:hypothetical protein